MAAGEAAGAGGAERWRGRVALVTGANSGIGAAVSRRLLDLGLTVVGLDREVEQLQMLAMARGARLLPLQCDLHAEEEVLASLRWMERTLAGPDLLVNCAGVAGEAGVTDGSPADWRRVLDVNVVALCLLSREAVRSMRARGLEDGLILNVGSAPAAVLESGWELHEASKAAVRVLTAGLRRELAALGCPVRVAMVSPGLTRTRLLLDAAGPRAHERVFGSQPALAPEDVAGAVAFALQLPPAVQLEDLVITPMPRAPVERSDPGSNPEAGSGQRPGQRPGQAEGPETGPGAS